jgi:hypothetical protein
MVGHMVICESFGLLWQQIYEITEISLKSGVTHSCTINVDTYFDERMVGIVG